MMDELSSNNAIPKIKVGNTTSLVAHEASAGKINEADLFYLMSR
jgi:Fe-S cluster assembly scaffold protein SufB